MAGLLLKEWYTLSKQFKLYIIAILIFTVIPGLDAVLLAIVFTAILPMTAMSYDERSKWDNLAVTMPYSPTSMVFSKYLASYITLITAIFLSVTMETLFSIAVGAEPKERDLLSVAAPILAVLIVQGITIPIMFKFGVEKGRYIFLMVYMLVFFVGMALSRGDGFPGTQNGLSAGALPILIAAVVVINIISVYVSAAIYKRKQF